MNIIEELNHIEMLRPIGCPSNIGQCGIIILEEQIHLINDLLLSNPHINLKYIFMPGKFKFNKITLNNNLQVNVLNINQIGNFPAYQILILEPSVIHLTNICRILAQYKICHVWIVGKVKDNYCQRMPIPDYLQKHINELTMVYNFFPNDSDKIIFLRRIKSIITGNSAYLPVSEFIEYQHPDIHPEANDIMIDGGISDMVNVQEIFSRQIGEDGYIYGFEPIKWMADKASILLEKYKNFKLICSGLSDKSGKAYFTSSRDSSHLASKKPEGSNLLECDITTIDEFCFKNNINKITCIKLDIEGAELVALKGAKNVLRRDYPKLIICLYHNPQDLYEIPLYIKSICPDYVFHIAHSSAGFNDTILYAIHDKT